MFTWFELYSRWVSLKNLRGNKNTSSKREVRVAESDEGNPGEIDFGSS